MFRISFGLLLCSTIVSLPVTTDVVGSRLAWIV